MLIYQSDFSSSVSETLIASAERKLNACTGESNIHKKIFNVAVEVIQNMVNHSLDQTCTSKWNIFKIAHDQSQYFILSGNPIRKNKVPALTNALDQLNSLDKKGLKQLHHWKIKNATLSPKGGAGLGLISIARKSGQKLNWLFTEINQDFSYFKLKVTIQDNSKFRIHNSTQDTFPASKIKKHFPKHFEVF